MSFGQLWKRDRTWADSQSTVQRKGVISIAPLCYSCPLFKPSKCLRQYWLTNGQCTDSPVELSLPSLSAVPSLRTFVFIIEFGSIKVRQINRVKLREHINPIFVIWLGCVGDLFSLQVNFPFSKAFSLFVLPEWEKYDRMNGKYRICAKLPIVSLRVKEQIDIAWSLVSNVDIQYW